MSSSRKRIGSYEPPSPPSSKVPRRDVQESDSSEDEEEDPWEVECQCGLHHDDGYTVQCDRCKTWQHTVCMGLPKGKVPGAYKCVQCDPRNLSVSKEKAKRIQRKFLEEKWEAERMELERARRLEAACQGTIIRKIIPTRSQSLTNRSSQGPKFEQLNQYSKGAYDLINSLDLTNGADSLLRDSTLRKSSQKIFVERFVEGLGTTENMKEHQLIIQVIGYVSLLHEASRQPGGGNGMFMYDGLMVGVPGAVIRDCSKFICIDTKVQGNDSTFTRRSCNSNSVLKHVIGSNGTLGLFIVSTKIISENEEVTLPFDPDWKESDSPLECAEHSKNLKLCAFEVERRRQAKERKKQMKDKENVKEKTVQKDQPSTSGIPVRVLPSPPPNPFQQSAITHHIPQLNEYLDPVPDLLKPLQQTSGADYLLEESRRNPKALRAFVSNDVEGLVTSKPVPPEKIILEMTGTVSIADEEEGPTTGTFLYKGLGTSPLQIKSNNDTRFTRKSCQPNSVLKHVIGSEKTLGVFIVSVVNIQEDTEVTLPFDMKDFNSELPLKCAEHSNNSGLCSAEQQRKEASEEKPKKGKKRR
ncbi:hypothetical protein CAEBREN_00592 [Caenorhabditis brenneri]|uniref:SET domain-containing protein n=1 Tax=Caenorhabditis brenneri TaxID=135651 RepID=G0MR33_CAEBE|nr:hypothetical protein CAEBREN_00592 [Caenorhabditis brenneri]